MPEALRMRSRFPKKFEAKLEEYGGSLQRSAVELAQEWRSDKAMRQLEAMLIAADHEKTC